jgi:hypothetical protein
MLKQSNNEIRTKGSLPFHFIGIRTFVVHELCALLYFVTFFWKNFRSGKYWNSYAQVKIQMLAETYSYVGLHVKYPLVLSDFKKNWNVRTTSSERPPHRIKISVHQFKY